MCRMHARTWRHSCRADSRRQQTRVRLRRPSRRWRYCAQPRTVQLHLLDRGLGSGSHSGNVQVAPKLPGPADGRADACAPPYGTSRPCSSHGVPGCTSERIRKARCRRTPLPIAVTYIVALHRLHMHGGGSSSAKGSAELPVSRMTRGSACSLCMGVELTRGEAGDEVGKAWVHCAVAISQAVSVSFRLLVWFTLPTVAPGRMHRAARCS